MSEKRFSELPPGQPLKDSDIFAVSQLVGDMLISGQTTLADLRAVMSSPVIYVVAGSRLNALTAAPGTYIFELGAELVNGPDTSVLKSMRHARLDVTVTGRVARLVVWGHFNESSGYMHGGEWALFNRGDTDKSVFWSCLGPGESASPYARKNWVMTQESAVYAEQGVK